MKRRTLIPIAAATAASAVSTAPTASTTSATTSGGLTTLPPLSLYIHYPWCVRKCPYCDFNSHEARSGIPEAAYLAALIRDLESALPQIWGRHIVSVFIGGGTPSLLSAQAVDALLAALRARLPLLADAEITLEANPGTVEADKFAAFRATGINRLSLGIQSFDDRHLAALGRIHSGDEARRAIELALRHFDNVNLDLMYALPQQTLAEARRDIESAAGYGGTHLSAYHLTLEPNTAFHHAPPPLPDDDLAADMQEMVESTLAAQGFEHYETSAYARAGRRCAHNLNYWTYGDYLGIGAGAHGKISSPGGIVREARRRHPRDYLAAVGSADFIQERHAVGLAERPFEFMMNALRLAAGFAPPLFEAHTGLPLATQTDALLAASRQGLLTVDHERIAPTPHGQRFLNDLLTLFLPA
ncbi:putative oxidoreductase [Sterolibacterium denitrificans]|uniref:Heme chaperone HemW n=1 Tax=Sterolibacterium denitrificans TaxID=157592 RepID=A0A7Z7HPK1_9PROT|nr:radical SAM family heme chaperone HemW [Sterolibacterium denitrificans]SMB22857.1 putative oxidoreductase [Sterolibacterium denitrificans]